MLKCLDITFVTVGFEVSSNHHHSHQMELTPMQGDVAGASAPRSLSPADFPAEQLSRWVGVSDQKAQAEAVVSLDTARTNETAGREWFVAYADPRRETSVARTLKRRDFVAYVPTMRVSRTLRTRRVTAGSPLFPRYVFVGLSVGQNLYGLRETPGLEGMVKIAGAPVTVAPSIISGLREQEDAGVFDFSDEAADAKAAATAAEIYTAGRKVRVRAGPFLGFAGIVNALLPDARISVFITLFGRAHPVPMPLAHIEVEC